MKKLFTITLITLGVFATADDSVVTYGGTTYGPSDTVVHYDTHGSDKEKSAIRANHPSDKLYPATEKK
ncbi:hypothetical protein [Hydrogenimonas sp.]